MDTKALGTVRTAVTDAAAMFVAFVYAVVIVVEMEAVKDAMNVCMMPANAAAESLTAGFVSAFKFSVPELIAARSADGSYLLYPLIFSVFVVLLSDGGSDKMLNLAKCRRISAKR